MPDTLPIERKAEVDEATLTATSFAVATVVIVAVLFAHWDTVTGVASLWWDTATYSHGLLVAPIAIYLWWKQRDRTPAIEPRLRIGGAIALVAISALMLLCDLAFLRTGSAALLPLAVIAAVYVACGWPVARLLVVPALVFFCALPMWSVFTYPMQIVSTIVSAQISAWLGIAVTRHGTFIEIPSGVFEVTQGCSGLNLLLVSLCVGLLIGEMHRLRWRPRVALLAVATAIALFANWLRIIALVVIGDRTAMKHYLVSVDHYAFGWLLFSIFLALFIWIAGRVIRGRPGLVQSSSSADAPAENLNHALDSRRLTLALGARTALAIACAVWGSAAAAAIQAFPPQAIPASSDTLPKVVGWYGPEEATGAWRPRFPGADREWRASYRRGGQGIDQHVSVYRNVFLHQAPGRELISSDNSLAPGDEWRVGTYEGVVPDAPKIPVRVLIQLPQQERWLVTYWYDIDGYASAGALSAKLRHALNRLLRKPEFSGLIAVAIRCDRECDSARGAADEFLSASGWLQAGAHVP